ncbi:ankyrin repeat-containing domain protein [Dunaliella salina]|uniref:Ankyrin repeat-containing domain protein n=1 Tax=Dunaliella salina TaxID=3046 RepID=A0ABQ7FZN1_DUNSA|nr:ankyrin repeat-containing domain protein [Dunaliella salina]|eukprot:KAF5827800.1 ankyrin repeat-containing domain protein [Dunaliella salina]
MVKEILVGIGIDPLSVGSNLKQWGQELELKANNVAMVRYAQDLDVVRHYSNSGAHWGPNERAEDHTMIACRYAVALVIRLRSVLPKSRTPGSASSSKPKQQVPESAPSTSSQPQQENEQEAAAKLQARLLKKKEAEDKAAAELHARSLKEKEAGENAAAEYRSKAQFDLDGHRAVFLASCDGNVRAVRALLTEGVCIDKEEKEPSLVNGDEDGDTPLISAAGWGHQAVVKELIAQGAAVNKANKDGRTALILASSEGHLTVVKELIARGASINAADNIGATPLLWAVERGHLAVVKELIARGASLDKGRKVSG